MKDKAFNRILDKVPLFQSHQRLEMYDALEHSGDLNTICDLFEKAFAENLRCPHCSGTAVIRNGYKSELIRYRCKECCKTFNCLTGTAFAHLRKKELWLSYIQQMLTGNTVRKSARELNINKSTAFKWRHRFLDKAHEAEASHLSGIIEADETYFRKSQKGSRHLNSPARKRGEPAKQRGLSKEHVCVLVACDRSNHEADYITGTGPVTSWWLDRFLTKHIDPDAVLVTDSARSYDAFCNHQHIEHVSINASKGERTKGAYHIQHVNSYHSTLKGWIRHFRGVATKYLNHYLGWCHLLCSRHIQDSREMLKLLYMSSKHT